MSALKNLALQNAPRWAVVTIAVCSLLALGYGGWVAATGREGEVGPPKKVYPGMYDLRAEVAKMRAAKERGAMPNGR